METRVDGKDFIPGNYVLVHPTLATKVGLNESIVIQEIHAWSETNKEVSHGELCRIFPFWSEREIKNILLDLEGKGMVVLNQATGYYSIDYKILNSILKA